MEDKNPWIKWKDRAPTEADLPIECAVFGDSVPTCWIEIIPIGHRNYNIWRPYICDIPKAEAVRNEYKNIYIDKKAIDASKLDREEFYRYAMANMMKKINELEDKQAFFKRCQECSKETTPDANGWWRIEDRKPEDCQDIKFTLKGLRDVFKGYYHNDGIVYDLDNGTERDEDDIEKWCLLDMTGPEEKMNEEIKLPIGTLVKIRSHGERFWCGIIGMHDDGSYQARVNNDLLVAPFKFGEEIRIELKDILDVWVDEKGEK
jgi:hypothetical protein